MGSNPTALTNRLYAHSKLRRAQGAEHPDTFLTCLYGAHAGILVQIVRDQAAGLKNPPLSAADVLDTLAQHVPETATLLRAAIAGQDEAPDSPV